MESNPEIFDTKIPSSYQIIVLGTKKGTLSNG